MTNPTPFDRARGALVGLAIGDALGTTNEFKPRDTYEPLTDIVGGGPFRLAPGQWTDDTAMALALAYSLLRNARLDERDLMDRFCNWWQLGSYSCTGTCFDIGTTTRHALLSYQLTSNPIAGSVDPNAAGNGSLMRLAPVAILYWNDSERRSDIAARQSKTTHAAEEAVQSCVAYAELIARAIGGVQRDRLFLPLNGPWEGAVAEAMSMSAVQLSRDQAKSSGYVIHSLEAVLWAVGGARDFEDAVLRAANLGDDADTTAAVAGQLAGALWGLSGIPDAWQARLAWRDEIVDVAGRLYEASLSRVE